MRVSTSSSSRRSFHSWSAWQSFWKLKNLGNVLFQPGMVLLDTSQDLFWPFFTSSFSACTKKNLLKIVGLFPIFIHGKVHWEYHHAAKISRDRLSIQVSCRRGGLGEGSMDTCTGNDTPREPGIHPGSLDLGAHNTHIAQMPKIFHQKLLHRGAQLLRLNYFF